MRQQVRVNAAFRISLALFFLLVAGCATLPKTVDVGERESQEVLLAFQDMIDQQKDCQKFIDASVTVSFDSWLQSGAVDGYLQSMAPSYLKFVGLSPLGQPIMILVTDGTSFHYVNVPEAKGFEGNVRAKKFIKYAPEGFSPKDGFYWLTGRLSPGRKKVVKVTMDDEKAGYWLEISHEPESPISLVLFDPQEKVVLRHILQNEQKSILMDVDYADYYSLRASGGENLCPMPAKVVVSSHEHNGTMTVLLDDWFSDAVFSESDFKFDLPVGFERILLK